MYIPAGPHFPHLMLHCNAREDRCNIGCAHAIVCYNPNAYLCGDMKKTVFAYAVLGLAVAAAGGCGKGSVEAGGCDGSELWLPQAEGKACVIPPDSITPTIEVCVDELRRHSLLDTVSLALIPGEGKPGAYRIEGDGVVCGITANTDIGLLYGAYELLRRERMGENPACSSAPAIERRILNHWDNLDGTIERGYAGHSLWQWDSLPDVRSGRYEQYARACASVGINGTVLNNVNASARILSGEYLRKVAALADAFRPYGLKVYLSVNFASPMLLDSLDTADPLNPGVRDWWRAKADEIYSLMPDFGGFLVKANSEGQPGPCDYGRSHAQGANMLAEALAPHGGLVMWRAFVYSPDDADRAKQAYNEFQPLDGQFADNVIIQIKNGPVDFQPREPLSPLLAAMSRTKKMIEFQITQEYLGHSNHLAFLAPMWRETLDVLGVEQAPAVAGVANIGDDTNWTGHPMAQANWYAFGRLAWDPSLSSERIAGEWAAQWPAVTDASAVPVIEDMLMRSREAVVDYMMPMGLHHIFAFGHHYGPEPWCEVEGARPDWLPKYYHRADSAGIGFDRTMVGSGATGQYPEALARIYDDVDKCPEEYLLWFHHVPWSHRLAGGKTVWESMCAHYDRGVSEADSLSAAWESLAGKISPSIYADVSERLGVQSRDARWWHDACLLYFSEINGLPFAQGTMPAEYSLDSLKAVSLGITNYECPTASLLRRKLCR